MIIKERSQNYLGRILEINKYYLKNNRKYLISEIKLRDTKKIMTYRNILVDEIIYLKVSKEELEINLEDQNKYIYIIL